MGRHYSHLSAEERAVLQVERGRGTSYREIRHRLGRGASTLSREVKRQTEEINSAHGAASAYRLRRSRCVRARKLAERTPLFPFVHDRLVFDRWSPQQIAARLRDMHPADFSWRISHEAIYTATYAHPRGGLKLALMEALRQGKPARGRRRTTAAGRT